MSHEIENNMMFSVRETPWHKQGTVLANAPTTEEAILSAKLDWEVRKVPNYIRVNISGVETYHETESRSIVRMSDTGPIILGTVSGRYEPVQNREAFKVFDRIMADNGYTYETAGAVKNGKKVWILAKAPEGATIGDDRINQYVAIVTSHDGTMNLRLLPTAVRIVCNNTMTWALQAGENDGFSIRHTGDIREKLEFATNVLRSTQMSFARATEIFNHMNDMRIEPMQAIKYWERVIPFLRKRGDSNAWKTAFDNIAGAFMYGRGNRGETLWDAYNALTEWTDHIRNTASHRVLDYAIFGEGGRIKRDGVNVATEIIADQIFSGPAMVGVN
ncbi:MAG: DUF932 domain-containing protein [Bacteroidetes bacterium]|nr:DUF932 domain-containing protein [Bacteroidota bacterium]